MTLNGKVVDSLRTIVRNGDVVSHTLHRHEPPVTGRDIGVVHEDDDIIVIDKPAGVPVHPAGRYNYNSVVEIMRAERGYHFNPSPCNRLDRLTSGIMFIGKHARAAERMSVKLRERTVRKEYVARVVGKFPDGEVVCEQPIRLISPRLGLNRVRADGKDARTVFRRLAYFPPGRKDVDDSKTAVDSPDAKPELPAGMAWKGLEGSSIVRCFPLTGRTHQIRVHLQFLGHPISNDPIYCNQRVFGAGLGKGDDGSDDDDDIIARLSKMGKTEVAEAVAYHDELVDRYEKARAEKMTGEFCDVCDTPLYSDPGPRELGIYLHAQRYACDQGKWAYETPLPDWTLPQPASINPTEVLVDADSLTVDLDNLQLESTKPLGAQELNGATINPSNLNVN